MSLAFYIVLDRDDPGFDTLVSGKSLAREVGRLGGLADSLGLEPIESYVSYSPEEARSMAEELGGDLPEGLELPEVRWFDPGEGVDYVSRLLDAVVAGAAGFKKPAGIAEDLREFKELLVKAQAIGARWRLQVDF